MPEEGSTTDAITAPPDTAAPRSTGRPAGHRVPAWLGDRRRRRLPFLLFTAAVVLAAWVHDDAYITFRVVDNIAAGYGPVWNVDERVQVFTHPLWMLLHAALYPLTGNVWATTLALSIAASAAAAAVLLWGVARPRSACLAGLLLVASRGFVEYSTSGLENPLTHLLLALFFLQLVRGGDEPPLAAAAIAGLGALNRLDSFLLFLPGLVLGLAGCRRRRQAAAAALALGPAAAWGLFSLVYYGSPLPNTAAAKLGIGVPLVERLYHGVAYFIDSLADEPVALLVVAWALAAAWPLVRRWRRLAAADRGSAPGAEGPARWVAPAAALGALLYLVYLLGIGGGYMRGRMLSAPFFAAVVALSRSDLPRRLERMPRWAPALALLALLRSATGAYLLPVRGLGVGDERHRFLTTTGLVQSLGEDPWPSHYWRFRGETFRRQGRRLVVYSYIGIEGFYAGPGVHIVDTMALTDPLLARLPGALDAHRPWWPPGSWTAGHVARPLPAGYLDSLRSGGNRIRDPDLASLYDDVLQLTRAPLWSGRRWGAIARLARGRRDPRLGAYLERHRQLFAHAPVLQDLWVP